MMPLSINCTKPLRGTLRGRQTLLISRKHTSRLSGRPLIEGGTGQSCTIRSLSVTRCAAIDTEVDVEWDVTIEQFPAPSAGAFLPDKRSFREEHRIRGYEVSPDQRATIVTVANLLQEVAGNHAVGMWGRTDEGFASLPSMKDVLFVMTRLQVRMYEYPKWGDIVAVETYFTEEGRLAFRRDWRVTDAASGKLLGAATSTWVNINMATRRLTKVPDGLRKRFLRFGPSTSVHVLPPEETKRKLPDMQLPGQVQGPRQVARRSDMDMNGHINNVTYLAWVLESVPEDVYGSYQLHEIELDFKSECKAGDVIESHCNPLSAGDEGAPLSTTRIAGEQPHHQHPIQLLHLLQKCDDSSCTELVRLRSTWRQQPAADTKSGHALC